MNEGNDNATPQPKADHAKERAKQLVLPIVLRITAAVTFFGGAAALAESSGLTRSDKPGIIGTYVVYLLAAATYACLIGVSGRTGARIAACAILGWLSAGIFLTFTGSLLCTLVPLVLVAIVAAAALRYPPPQPEPAPPQPDTDD